METRKKKWWIFALLAAVAAVGAAGWFCVSRAVNSPQSLFEPTTLDTSHLQSPQPEDGAGKDQSAQKTVLPDIVNIMIMGIDAYENGDTTSGTEPHADVCMVLAIDFKNNDINLVSLPRDTFITTPGYYGYYKLNCVFNVGGGLKDPDGGFRQVCRTAEQLMGGVSIPYYYAVDFQAVVDLVDAIGGIDFDVDTPYHTLSGAYYQKGLQHLDGDGVMGYLRIRGEADGLDTSRTARQRKMLVALFEKLKSEKKITQLLSVLGEVYDDIYTNTNLAQTAALLNYAATIGSENITTRSMKSPTSSHYVWLFAFVDQQYRIDLIKDIYGFDAKPLAVSTIEYERWAHEVCFPAQKAFHQAKKVLDYYEAQQAAGVSYSADAQARYEECVNAYTALVEAFQEADASIQAVLGKLEISSEELNAVWKEQADLLSQLRSASNNAATALARLCGYPKSLSWNIASAAWIWDTDINEVPVDFN